MAFSHPKRLSSSPTTTTSTTASKTIIKPLLSHLLRSRQPPQKKQQPPPPPQPWPEHPFPLIHHTGASPSRLDIPEGHFCIRNAQLMALTHNTIFRALNAIHAQAESCSSSRSHSRPSSRSASHDDTTQQDLLAFVLTTCAFITNHHESEERAFFPAIEQFAERPGLMAVNVAQHAALERDLEGLRAYAAEGFVQNRDRNRDRNGGGEGGFEAGRLRALVEGLAGSLGGHMRDEIGCILELHRWVPSSVLEGVYAGMHHAAAAGMDKWKSGPFVFGCQDADFLLDGEKIPFPEVPVPFVVPFIIEQVVARRHSGAWRFCPSSAYGRPRPFTGRPLSSPPSLLVQGLGRGLGRGSLLRALIGWLMVLFLAYEFGAYVRTIS